MHNLFTAFDKAIQLDEKLHKSCMYKTYPPDALILGEQDNSGSVYFILDGEVNVTGYSAHGREIWYSQLASGHLFGEMSALLSGMRTANVVTLTETRLAILSKSDFLSFLARNSDFSLWLLKELAQRLDTTTQQLYERIALNLSTRICVDFARRCAQEPNASGVYSLTPPPSPTKLAQTMNANRVNVSRVISDLIADSVLGRQGKAIVVLDREALIRRAES